VKDCGQGYKGDCCCECEHQVPIHVCECGKCSTVSGWICTIFWKMSQERGEQGRMLHHPNQHGCCEMHKVRTSVVTEEINEMELKSEGV